MRDNEAWNKPKSAHRLLNMNYNSFAPLSYYNEEAIIYYKCNNYGHIARFCRSVFDSRQDQKTKPLDTKKREATKSWTRKQEKDGLDKEKFMLIQTLQALQKMGSAPPTTANETPKALSQEKINEYAKIGEQGMAISSWIDQILKDSEEVIVKFTELYQNIGQANKEL